MTNLAVNEKGEAVFFDGTDWKPAPVAQNDKGERMAFDGKEWRSLSAPKSTGESVLDAAGDVAETVNKGVNIAGTQLTKGITGLLGAPRAIADLTGRGIEWLGKKVGAPETGRDLGLRATQGLRQTLPGGMGPSSEDLNSAIFGQLGVPEKNLGDIQALTLTNPLGIEGKVNVGKMLDVGLQAAPLALAAPGALFPAIAGGMTSEAAGQATEGSPWEIPARVAGGIAGGSAPAALAQNIGGRVAQGVRNIAPPVDPTAARIITKNLMRDKDTMAGLSSRQAALGPEATVVEAAGPNVRGTMRGAIAAPGQARTAAQDAFDARIGGSNDRTTAALSRSISPTDSLASTVDDLATARAKAAGPAYREAGIPGRIEATETMRPGSPVTRQSPILDAQGRPVSVTEPGAPAVQRSFNTPTVQSEKISALLAESDDVKTAIRAARRLPDFKNLPDTSMAMLDKAYKHLGGLEQAAKRAGNGERARDLGNVRRDLRAAITEVNPQYGAALEKFSGPSALIGAAERGKEWFTKNIDPAVAKREFAALSPDEQQSALIGIRDWARTTIGRSDRGTAAERVWTGGDHRARLQAILGKQGYDELARAMNTEKNLIKTSRDINVGSRTTPMALEAADNAMSTSVMGDLLSGHPFGAISRMVGGATNRMLEGRTEAVNARIAELLSSNDPQKVGLVRKLMADAEAKELARRTGNRNALTYGSLAPTIGAISGGR